VLALRHQNVALLKIPAAKQNLSRVYRRHSQAREVTKKKNGPFVLAKMVSELVGDIFFGWRHPSC
jgi:hypothetical protein